MKPSVKPLVLIGIFFISLASFSQTQSYKGIAADIKKVVDDFPSQFDHIRGEVIVVNPQSTDYRCTFKPAGAEECHITTYAGKKQGTNSWFALMSTFESFDEAAKKYKELYNQLNNLPVHSRKLKGIYEAPIEEKKFNSTLLAIENADESLKKLKLELVLEAEGMDWKLKILVYGREREDHEKGEEIE